MERTRIARRCQCNPACRAWIGWKARSRGRALWRWTYLLIDRRPSQEFQHFIADPPAMNAWIVAAGEPLPIAPAVGRLLRAGILCRMLAEQGHRVTWWTSTFDHFQKRHYFANDNVVPICSNFTIRLLHGRGYLRN